MLNALKYVSFYTELYFTNKVNNGTMTIDTGHWSALVTFMEEV